MPELQMDVAVANRFISSLSKSLQALCHGCMEFDSGIEIVGYINVNIDSGSKVDYVLNEKVLKSTTNSMTFVSNSFLAKKESQKQTRDGACSPIPHLSAISSNPSGAHPSPQYHRASHSQAAGGSHKRAWTDDWRISPKRHRMQNPQMGMQPFSDHNSQPHPQSFPSSSHIYSDQSFKQPQGPASGNIASSSLQLQINIKKEAFETDNQNAAESEHSADDQTHDSSQNGTNKIKIKCDPDADQSDTGETSLADVDSTAASEKTDFKGTFLDPSSSGDMLPSDDPDRQQESDIALPSFDENSETDCTDEQGLTEAATVSSARTANLGDAEAGMSGDNEAASDAAVEYDQAAEEESFSQSAYEDAGEGGSDAGQLEVIEIDDEDEDVQAMFGDTHASSLHKQKSYHMKRTGRGDVPRSSTLYGFEPSGFAGLSSSRMEQGQSESHNTHLFQRVRCPHCHEFIVKREMKEHISKNHGRTMPFSCSLCSRGYYSQSGLSSHMDMHTGKTVTCPVCSKKFSRKFALKRHMRVLHSSMQCSNCFAIVNSGRDYNEHVLYCTANQ